MATNILNAYLCLNLKHIKYWLCPNLFITVKSFQIILYSGLLTNLISVIFLDCKQISLLIED